MVNPEIGDGQDIGLGHISVTRVICKNCKFQESDQHVLMEHNEYAKRLVKMGYVGSYISTPLSIYHNYSQTAIDILIQAKKYQSEKHYKEAYNLAQIGLNTCLDINIRAQFNDMITYIREGNIGSGITFVTALVELEDKKRYDTLGENKTVDRYFDSFEKLAQCGVRLAVYVSPMLFRSIKYPMFEYCEY